MNIIKSEYEYIKDQVIQGQLQNGLTYYIIKKKKYISKLGLLTVKFGSVDNKFSINGKVHYVKDGTAHLLEHLAFEHKYYNTMEKFIKLGANVNAYTNFTNTSYHFSTASNYYYCLNVLADFVFSNYITENALKLEKDIVYNEIKMFLDNPQYKAFFNMLNRLIKRSPLSLPIVGSVSSLKSINIEELQSIFNTFYVPTNMAFVGVGDIDEKKVIEQLNNIKSKNVLEVKRYYVSDNSSVKNKIVKEKMNVSRQFFCFGLKTTFSKSIKIQEEIAFSIILDIVFGHSFSFYEILSFKGLIDNDFVTDFIPFNELGIILLQGTTNNAEQILEEILDVLDKISTFVFENDFEIIKRKKIGKLLQSFNNIDFIATFQAELFKKNINYQDYFKILNEINFSTIQRCLNKIKVDENYALSVISK